MNLYYKVKLKNNGKTVRINPTDLDLSRYNGVISITHGDVNKIVDNNAVLYFLSLQCDNKEQLKELICSLYEGKNKILPEDIESLKLMLRFVGRESESLTHSYISCLSQTNLMMLYEKDDKNIQLPIIYKGDVHMDKDIELFLLTDRYNIAKNHMNLLDEKGYNYGNFLADLDQYVDSVLKKCIETSFTSRCRVGDEIDRFDREKRVISVKKSIYDKNDRVLNYSDFFELTKHNIKGNSSYVLLYISLCYIIKNKYIKMNLLRTNYGRTAQGIKILDLMDEMSSLEFNRFCNRFVRNAEFIENALSVYSKPTLDEKKKKDIDKHNIENESYFTVEDYDTIFPQDCEFEDEENSSRSRNRFNEDENN